MDSLTNIFTFLLIFYPMTTILGSSCWIFFWLQIRNQRSKKHRYAKVFKKICWKNLIRQWKG